MFSKHMTAALIGSALLATAAVAQSPTTTPNSNANSNSHPAATTSTTSSESGYHGDWRSSKVVGLNVYNDSNEKLGSINDLLMDKSGKINAAVIGVGGFLGVGERLVAVSFDKIKFVDTPVPSTSASSSTTSAPAGSNNKGTTTTGSTTNSGTSTSSSSSSSNHPWYPDHAVFNATKEQLQALPEFKYST
jgi:sporulation protein YlmC with PRC-barrel domain